MPIRLYEPDTAQCRRCVGQAAVGVLRDDRIVQRGRAIRVDEQPAAGAADADVVVGDGAVDDVERA